MAIQTKQIDLKVQRVRNRLRGYLGRESSLYDDVQDVYPSFTGFEGLRDIAIADNSSMLKERARSKKEMLERQRAIYLDKAMVNTQDKVVLENGGIDLNQIKIKRTGKTINVQFDPAQLIQLEQGGFKGFTPVIINITPISSPFQLLGINTPKQEVQLAKF
jgi:hypothetical protein